MSIHGRSSIGAEYSLVQLDLVVSLSVEALGVLSDSVSLLHCLLGSLDSVNALATDTAYESIRCLLPELDCLTRMDTTCTALVLHEVVVHMLECRLLLGLVDHGLVSVCMANDMQPSLRLADHLALFHNLDPICFFSSKQI